MRPALLTLTILLASGTVALADAPGTPLNIDPSNKTSLNVPQRVAWENKSDRLSVVPVAAQPDVNNFAGDGKDPENTKR